MGAKITKEQVRKNIDDLLNSTDETHQWGIWKKVKTGEFPVDLIISQFDKADMELLRTQKYKLYRNLLIDVFLQNV